MTRFTMDEYKAYIQKQGTAKYHNIRTEYNGVMYDSKKEAVRARDLDFLVKAKKITNLKRQVNIPLMVNGVKVATYRADFTYTDAITGEEIIEDVKGVVTQMFKLKKRILEANGFTILIT